MGSNTGIMRYVRLTLVLLMVTMLCVTTHAIVRAASITVNTTADALHGSGGVGCVTVGGTCSLRDAVLYADVHAGATITLPSGLYKLTIPTNGTNDGTTGHLNLAADMTINGAGASTTTIDGGSIANDGIFIASATVSLNGLTMANGKSTHSGGALAVTAGATVNVTDCIFDHNTAFGAPAAPGVVGQFAAGGAIYNASVLVVLRSVFTNNTAHGGKGGFANGPSRPGGFGSGGAIALDAQNVITLITASTFSGNSAVGGDGGDPNAGAGGVGGGAQGGAITLGGGNASISGTTFVGNSAVGGTGAVGAAEFTDGTPGGGGGISSGGAIITFASNGDISNSTFVSNTALGGNGGNGGPGGFGYQQGSGGAGGGASGGAISVQTNGASITNVTIDGNGTTGGIGGVGGANTHGAPGARGVGGIYTISTDTYVTNSILSGNGGGNCDIFTLHGGHNLYFDPSTGCGDTAPIFGNPGLTPLGNYGGPTQTHGVLPTSPAIDAGDDTSCGLSSVAGLDQRGIKRPQGAHCDIGATEARFTLTLTGGNNQVAAPGTQFTQPLVVTFGGADAPAILGGVTITFTVPTSGASALLGGFNPGTDAAGQVSVIPRANPIAGQYLVTASTPGAAPVTFSLANGTVSGLPTPHPSGGTGGSPSALPETRPAGSLSGSPNSLPVNRP